MYDTDLTKEILDRYEKAIEMYIKYKDRIERHEIHLRNANQEIQSLKGEINLYKAKIEDLKEKLNNK